MQRATWQKRDLSTRRRISSRSFSSLFTLEEPRSPFGSHPAPRYSVRDLCSSSVMKATRGTRGNQQAATRQKKVFCFNQTLALRRGSFFHGTPELFRPEPPSRISPGRDTFPAFARDRRAQRADNITHFSANLTARLIREGKAASRDETHAV